MRTYFAVTGVLLHKEKLLILKKSPDDYNYPNRWSFCSGFVKEFEAAEDTVLREIKEETGLDAQIITKGNIVIAEDKKLGKRWIIMPFLCKTKSTKVKLCHENIEFKWIEPKDIKNFNTVPSLIEDLEQFRLIK